jgi:hypothetical protein
VYCEGSPIGYVAHEQTDTAHLLFDTLHPIVPARIVGVDAESKRHFYIEAEMSESALRRQFDKREATDAWKDWRCSFSKLPMPEVWKNCQVLEFQIEQEFPVQTLEQVRNLKTYIKLWIDRSLHDFSVEAMQLRQRYIDRLRSVGNGAFDAEVKRLEKQYAAICSGQRMTYRMKWWKELQHSASMEHYWDQWRSSRREDNLWKDLYTVDSQLRRMPDGLYAHIGDLTCQHSAASCAFCDIIHGSDPFLKFFLIIKMKEHIFCHCFKRCCQKTVTCKCCHVFTIYFVVCQTASPVIIIIHTRQIVMYKRICMDIFYCTRIWQSCLNIATRKLTCSHYKTWSQSFPACNE